MPDPRTYQLLEFAGAAFLPSMSDLAREDQRREILALEQLDATSDVEINPEAYAHEPHSSGCKHPYVCEWSPQRYCTHLAAERIRWDDHASFGRDHVNAQAVLADPAAHRHFATRARPGVLNGEPEAIAQGQSDPCSCPLTGSKRTSHTLPRSSNAGSIDIKAIPHCAVPQRSFCLHLRPCPRVCRETGVVR